MDEDREREPESEFVDASPELDMVALFASSDHKAEMEAMAINGLLQANGIPSVIVGPSTIPSLEFQVQVPRHLLDDARRTIEEARASGPDAADEAEQASEGTV
ncbi:MAG TPA: hypothetical protein VN442_11070 [Bryobacteraceae bacterium]|nr:hypothetical protein [Bryobacteraceae bacterium]